MGAISYKHIIKFMLENEKSYDFPTLMKKLRTTFGVPRSKVTEATGITQDRLYNLESGKFVCFPKEDINLLADYYNVPKKILHKKWKEYLALKTLFTNGKTICMRIEHEVCDTRATDQPNEA